MLDLVSGLEPVGRGPSMGAMGFWSGGGLRLGLTIRTVAFDAGSVHVWAGGGITWRSVAGAEVAEAEAKAAGVVEVLGGAGLVAAAGLWGFGGSPDLEGAFFGFFAEVVGPFGPVEAQPGVGESSSTMQPSAMGGSGWTRWSQTVPEPSSPLTWMVRCSSWNCPSIFGSFMREAPTCLCPTVVSGPGRPGIARSPSSPPLRGDVNTPGDTSAGESPGQCVRRSGRWGVCQAVGRE
ncbi:hypothetical protein GCM10029992_45120 [Glycomyces albus]